MTVERHIAHKTRVPLSARGEARDTGRRSIKAIKQAIQERVAAGAYPLAERLPSERFLCTEFKTSRVTLHEALIQLEAEGLIYREERRGWFVSPRRFVYNPQSRGHFTQAARQQGRTPSIAVIDKQIFRPPGRVFDLLQIPYDTEMIRIRRVRSIDGRPVQYAEHFYRADAFPGLFEQDLSLSLTDLFSEKYDHRYGHMRYQITPTSVTGDAATSLRVADGSPALLVLRISEALNGVRDCDFEYWRHDAIVLEVDVPGP